MATNRRSDTIWYPRYPGDYQRKTSHLTLVEHGVYSVLLDHYYATGKPIPANASRLQTICKAFAPDDVAALHTILREFFVETDAGYINERAEEELTKRQEISEKRRNAANNRYRSKPETPRQRPSKNDANAPANAHTATATANEESSNEDSVTRQRNSRATRLPEDWSLPEDYIDVAIKHGLTRGEAITVGQEMLRWSLTKPKGVSLRWKQTFVTFINTYKKSRTTNARPNHRPAPLSGWIDSIQESAAQHADHVDHGEGDVPLLHSWP